MEEIKKRLKRYTLVQKFLNSYIWRCMYYWRGCLRHRLTLLIDKRLTYETYTRFMRVPSQFAVLAGPVIEKLRPTLKGRQLRIIVLGCSNGSEPYTIASTLASAHPDLDFRIVGVDLSKESLAQADSGLYHREEIYNNEMVTEDFVNKTFTTDELNSDMFLVNQSLREKVEFHCLNALDENLGEKLGTADIVFSQNIMCNMEPKIAREIFDRAVSLLSDNGAIFLDGADLHQRTALTEEYGLKPESYKVREVHADVMQIRADGWPGIYWGIEPYWEARSDAERRYSTVFVKTTT